MRADAQVTVIEAISRGRKWVDEIATGKVGGVEALAARGKRSQRSIRMTLSLAFLGPDIVRAIMEGALPRGISQSRLADPPTDWAEQRKVLGISLRPISGQRMTLGE